MVWARKTKRGTVYYATFTWDGQFIREKVSGDRREAERVERKRKREVANGTYLGPALGTATTRTLAQHGDEWARRLRTRSASDDRQRWRDHIRPYLGEKKLEDIRPRHVIAWIEALSAKRSASLVASCHSVLSRILEDARIKDLITTNPARGLPRGTLPRRSRRTTPPGTREEAELLLTSEAIPEDRRIIYGLLFLAGLRVGEAIGRRWSDIDELASPLWRLLVHDQYDRQPLKTSDGEFVAARDVPIHPALAEMLDRWRREGFARTYGRHPRPEDPISPDPRKSRGGDDLPTRTKNQILKALYRDCDSVGITRRGTHTGRRWFASYSRMDGASKDIIERITHNPTGEVIDRYTYFGWESLCAEVLKLKVLARPAAEVVSLPRAVNEKYHRNYHAEGDGALLSLETRGVLVEAPRVEAGAEAAKMRQTRPNSENGGRSRRPYFPGPSDRETQTITRVITRHDLEDTPELRADLLELLRSGT